MRPQRHLHNRGHRRRVKTGLPRRAASCLLHRRRLQVPAGRHPAPAARALFLRRRSGGVVGRTRARAALLLARAQLDAQHRLRHALQGQQERLCPVRPRGHGGPSDYRGQYFYWQSFILVAATTRATPTRKSRRCLRTAGRRLVPRQAADKADPAHVRHDLGRAVYECHFRPARIDLPFLDESRPVFDRSPPRPPLQRAYLDAYLSVFGRRTG